MTNERRLFLVRHGTPAFPHEERHYYSRTDYLLSELGQEDARLMANRLKKELRVPFQFYSSPLLRSRNTADALSEIWPEAGTPKLLDDLMELNCGVWEGMLFSEVEQQFPEAFELRGDDPSFYTPPEAETHEACQERVFTAIEEIVRSTKEDVVVVAHAMVNLLFLAKVLDWPITGIRGRAQPYGGFNILKITENGYEPILLGQMPTDAPSEAKIAYLKRRYGMHPGVVAHTTTVRGLALSLAAKVNEKRRANDEPLIDTDVLNAAAILHDIARGEPKHAKAGAAILLYEGFPKIADVIGKHQDLPVESQRYIDESSLLYLADKCVLEDDVVGIEARFNDSYYVCDTEKAKVKHARRKEAALKVKETLETQEGIKLEFEAD